MSGDEFMVLIRHGSEEILDKTCTAIEQRVQHYNATAPAGSFQLSFSTGVAKYEGGSGCGCSAAVLTGSLLPRMERGEIKRLLLMSTGALLSTVSPFQGESIPGIAHAISLEVE